MTEIPIVVSDDVVAVGGYTNQVELQLSVGATGERGSRIFTGSVDPTTLPTDSPIWGGYTDFKSGDIYLLRDTGVLEVWEWLYASGEYTWVRTVNDIGGGGDSVTLDPDLDAIANLTGTGLARRTAPNTWTLDTAAYLTSNQTITLSGDVSGSGTTSIVTTVADDSHSHTEATISALAAKAPLASPTFTGTVTGLVSSSTDNAVARFDGTTGALQNSGVTIDDRGNLAVNGAASDFGSTSRAVQVNAGTDGYASVLVDSEGRVLQLLASDNNGVSAMGTRSNFPLTICTNDTTRITVDTAGKVTLAAPGSTAGLEFGASGPRMMMGTGGPSGISAPVGSTWRQTDANASHGNLTGLLWNKVGTGTSEGIDWLVDYEGRWVSYTPTVTPTFSGSFTSKSASGTYTRVGKQVIVHVVITITTNGTASGVNFSLPVSGAVADRMGWGREDAVNGKSLNVRRYSLTDAEVHYYDNANPNADGLELICGYIYEI